MNIQFGGLLAAVVFMAASPAFAKNAFDGRTPLLCTIAQLHECNPHAGCQLVPVETAADVRHLSFNFKNKTVRLAHWDPGLTSSIDGVDTIDDTLVVQGMDPGDEEAVDGAGWTLSVNKTYGTMVMTVSGRDVAFVGMGSCIAAD